MYRLARQGVVGVWRVTYNQVVHDGQRLVSKTKKKRKKIHKKEGRGDGRPLKLIYI